MSDLDLEAIEACVQAATPGPGEFAATMHISLYNKLPALVDEIEDLRACLRDLFRASGWDEGGDGGALQDVLVGHGLLVQETRTVPCEDRCRCLDYADRGKQVTCFRPVPWLRDSSK